MPVCQEPRRLLGEGELGVGQAEQPHLAVGERLQLSRTPANAVVLSEHDPAALARKRQPRRIVSLLGGLLAIDVG